MENVVPPEDERLDESPLIPILVDGMGRDGTTLAMQLLASSPGVVFDRVFPYERRYFSYFLALSKLIELDSREVPGWSQDTLGDLPSLVEHGFVGPLPWPDRELLRRPSDPRPPLSEVLLEALWRDFSAAARETVRADHGDPVLRIPYYAQKVSGLWAFGLDRLPPAKVVSLLRDPRDVWVSATAFHARRLERGEGAFIPVGEGEAPIALLPSFIESQRLRLEWLRDIDDEVLTVRYDGLVSELPGRSRTARRLAGDRPRLGGLDDGGQRSRVPHNQPDRGGIHRALEGRDAGRGRGCLCRGHERAAHSPRLSALRD